MTTPQPIQLTPAELAVVYQVYLGQKLPGGDNLLADLQVSAGQVEQARRSLAERGLLRPTPDQRDLMLSPQMWRLFSTVLYPQTLGVVQLTRPNQSTQNVHFSWQPGRIVLNQVDAAGRHHLLPLNSAGAVAAEIMRLCGLDEHGANGSAPADAAQPGPVDPDKLVKQATLRALFLLVVEAGGPQETPEALSWLLADGRLWLLARRDQGSAVLTPMTTADLRRLLEGIAERCAEAPLPA